MTRHLNAFAEWLGTGWGFLWTQGPPGLWFALVALRVLVPDPYTASVSELTYLIGGVLLLNQRRNDRALHAKLDALVIAVPGAPNDLAGVEKREA